VQRLPAAIQNRRFDLSPIDALINLVIGGRLLCQIPIRLDVHPVIHLGITTLLPQRWPARRGYVRGLGLHPDVVKIFDTLIQVFSQILYQI
jgi:hypothetical protein